MAVNIGEEEVDPLFREHIPHPQGNTIYIRIHRAVHLNIPAGEDLHHFPGASVENIDIHQIGKVQIRGGNTDVPPLHAFKEVIPFILAAFRQKPLHAEIGFTVPLEIPFRRIAFIAFQDDRHRTADEINLGVNDLFLQIGVADIRVGMVDNADVPRVFHDASYPHSVSLIPRSFPAGRSFSRRVLISKGRKCSFTDPRVSSRGRGRGFRSSMLVSCTDSRG